MSQQTPWFLKGSGNKEVNEEQHGDDDRNDMYVPNGFLRVLFIFLASVCDRFHNVSDDRKQRVHYHTDTDTFGDRIGKHHNGNRQKRARRVDRVGEVDILDVVLHHKHAHVYECGRRRRGRYRREQRQRKHRKEEHHRRGQSRKTRTSAGRYARARFHERGDRRSTQHRARAGRDRVRHHDLVIVMRFVVFVGQNSVTAAATDDRSHRVEHIDHAHRDDEHNNGEQRTGRESVFEHARKRAEHAVFANGEESFEILPELPGHAVHAARDDLDIRNAERNTQNRCAQNTDDDRTFYFQLVENGDEDKPEQTYRRACRRRVVVRKRNEIDERPLISDDNARVLETDKRDEQTDTDRNSRSYRRGHTLEDKLTDTLARDLDRGKQQEYDTRNEYHHQSLSDRKLEHVRTERTDSAADDRSEQRVQTHTRRLRQRHFREERHQQRTDDRAERGRDKQRRPSGIRRTRVQDLVRVDRQNVAHCKEGDDTRNDLRFDVRLFRLGVIPQKFAKLRHKKTPYNIFFSFAYNELIIILSYSTRFVNFRKNVFTHKSKISQRIFSDGKKTPADISTDVFSVCKRPIDYTNSITAISDASPRRSPRR